MQSSRTFDALRAIARVTLFACCTTIIGCVLVPIPTALPDAEPFTAEKLAPMQVGHTTRDEVRSLFAAWPYTTDDGVQTAHIEPQASDDGRYWVFGLPRQLGDWAVVGLFDYRPRNRSWADKQDHYENQWVLVEFGDSTVAAFWIASDKTPCSSGGVCYHEGYLQMIADEAANEAARSSITVSDRCVLYSYAENDFDTPVTVTDGVHTTQVFAKTSFVRTEMPAGPQTVSARVRTIPARVATVPITCAGNDVYYMALRQDAWHFDATLVAASAGKRAIAKRILVDRLVAARPSVCDPELRNAQSEGPPGIDKDGHCVPRVGLH